MKNTKQNRRIEYISFILFCLVGYFFYGTLLSTDSSNWNSDTKTLSSMSTDNEEMSGTAHSLNTMAFDVFGQLKSTEAGNVFFSPIAFLNYLALLKDYAPGDSMLYLNSLLNTDDFTPYTSLLQQNNRLWRRNININYSNQITDNVTGTPIDFTIERSSIFGNTFDNTANFEYITTGDFIQSNSTIVENHYYKLPFITDRINIARTNDIEMIEIVFSDDEVVYFIISNDGNTDSFPKNIDQFEALQKLLAPEAYEAVYLPFIEDFGQNDYVSLFQSQGLIKPFDPKYASLTGINIPDTITDTYLNQLVVNHPTRVGRANHILGAITENDIDGNRFRINRAHMYIVIDSSTEVIVSMAQINNPLGNQRKKEIVLSQ